MSKTDKQRIGQIGEDLAANYLEKQGFIVKDRNYLQKWGEIDLVVQKGLELRFVEVKTVTRATLRLRSGQAYRDDYEPEDNIHPWKLQRLGRAIETYLLEKNIADNVDWQLDALSVYVDEEGNLLKIEVLEDVF